MMKSNLCVKSNLMPDTPQYMPEKRYVPGDLYRKMFYSDARVLQKELTIRQKKEYELELTCLMCHRACGGTCR